MNSNIYVTDVCVQHGIHTRTHSLSLTHTHTHTHSHIRVRGPTVAEIASRCGRRPGLPVLMLISGLCGRKATLH